LPFVVSAYVPDRALNFFISTQRFSTRILAVAGWTAQALAGSIEISNIPELAARQTNFPSRNNCSARVCAGDGDRLTTMLG
jgi:hypothetical protein